MQFKWPHSQFDRFYPKASELRKHFEDVYSNPRQGDARRFCFDPWYIEGQFNHLRTPAEDFFPQPILQPFWEYLVGWGRKTLGCQMISPPWMSLYLSGHFQNWHADNPQGPFAFVYTLSPRWKSGRGGRTLILKPGILDYWNQPPLQQGYEANRIYDSLMPKWNRLLVFDPRLPHRVEKVNDVKDPLEGRLVIHGWFVDPRPMIEGEPDSKSLKVFLEDFVQQSLQKQSFLSEFRGYLCFRISVNPSGEIRDVRSQASTLVAPQRSQKWVHNQIKTFARDLKSFRFGKSRGRSELTLPFQFY